MKHCLKCDVSYPSTYVACSICQKKPVVIEGFTSFAPELAYDNDGFKADFFAELSTLEDNNFWFQSRNQLIIWALEKYHPDFNSLLEIGCGTGFVLSGINDAYPRTQLQGSELFITGLHFAAQRLPKVNLMQMDARKIPFAGEFDVIGAFDVLEHIEEDCIVLGQIHRALKPGGTALFTVPQHQWMWSQTDDKACHVRRYSTRELQLKLKKSGFDIVRSSSFVSILLPAMWLSRFLKSLTGNEFDARDELRISTWLNFILRKILTLEIALIKLGFNFPVGGSRLVVARKL